MIDRAELDQYLFERSATIISTALLAEFNRAIDDRVELRAQREAALALHYPVDSPHGTPPHCAWCVHELWPCRTAKTLGVTS